MPQRGQLFSVQFSVTMRSPRGYHIYMVRGYELCSPCSTGCFPCSNSGCTRRSVPGNDGRCDHCMGRGLRVGQKFCNVPVNTPCMYAAKGCSNAASLLVSTGIYVCSSCHRSGVPCTNASVGCLGCVPAKTAQLGAVCRFCLKRGPPCRGPRREGCVNPSSKAGVLYPRHQVPNNSSMCTHCKPARCSHVGCRASVQASSWTLKLCRRHAAIQPSEGSAGLARNIFKFAHCQSARRQKNAKCHIRWCSQLGGILQRSSGAKVAVCSAHRRWFQEKRHSRFAGFRHGYGAARSALDDYEFGRMRSTSLSNDGTFVHACPHCHALYFKGEATSAGKFRLCCKGGALRHLPLLPPAPTFLAQLLTGFIANDYQLPHPPHSLAAILTNEPLQGEAKQLAANFQQHIRRYNSALGFASFTDSHASPPAAPSCCECFGNGYLVHIARSTCLHITRTRISYSWHLVSEPRKKSFILPAVSLGSSRRMRHSCFVL